MVVFWALLLLLLLLLSQPSQAGLGESRIHLLRGGFTSLSLCLSLPSLASLSFCRQLLLTVPSRYHHAALAIHLACY